MVGARLLDRFVIEARIGGGGFGTVYRARDERLHREVAVKVVERPGDAPRVAREAQAAARLAHRNIATLYELAADGDRAYLVSELVDGETLRSRARAGGLSDRTVAEIGAGCAAALAHAHRHGVVHRDVKPENVLVPRAGGEAKLVDFGIARVAGESTLTPTGSVLGTIAYMAPEQADGLRPGPAADVYSLAITLYECWAGEHPFAAMAPAATARAIGEPIPPLADARPDLPDVLTSTIDAALDPDAERRPLASELEGVLTRNAQTLSGEPLPPAAPLDEQAPEAGRAVPDLIPRLACAGALAGMALVSALWAHAPPPIALALPAITLPLALLRPRPALIGAALASSAWMAIGAGEPGAAFVLLLLVAPLVAVPVDLGRSLPLPAAAPLLGAIGLAAAYPALAGLPRRAAQRLLLGAVGYLWLVAAETLSGKALLLDPVAPAPPGWRDSATAALSYVAAPLLNGPVLLGAAVWALAALALPVVVRGRFGALDLLGAILWAAALLSAERLLAGSGGHPGAPLAVVVLAAAAAVALAHFDRVASPRLPRLPRRARRDAGAETAYPPSNDTATA